MIRLLSFCRSLIFHICAGICELNLHARRGLGACHSIGHFFNILPTSLWPSERARTASSPKHKKRDWPADGAAIGSGDPHFMFLLRCVSASSIVWPPLGLRDAMPHIQRCRCSLNTSSLRSYLPCMVGSKPNASLPYARGTMVLDIQVWQDGQPRRVYESSTPKSRSPIGCYAIH